MADPFQLQSPIPSREDVSKMFESTVGPQPTGQDITSFRYNVGVGFGGESTGPSYPKSRRKMRMEEEFRKYQSQQLEDQYRMQQIVDSQRRLELQQMEEQRLQRNQDFEFEKEKMARERESKVQEEAGFIIDAIRGAVAPDGRVIARPIRPEDPNAIERLDNIARGFKFGIENKAAATMFSTIYNDALKFRQDQMDQSAKDEELAVKLSVQTGKPMKELGEYTEQGMFKPNVPSMIRSAEELKTAEEKKAEERVIATEARRAEAQAGVAEKRDIASQEKEIQKGIRKATEELRKMNAALAGRESLSEKEMASLDVAKNTLLDLQIEKAALRNLVFESAEQYKSAIDSGNKPPAGTIIYIGRQPVKVK